MAMIIDNIPLRLPASKSKMVSLNLNSYRNLHYQVNNKLKKLLGKALQTNCHMEGSISDYPLHLEYTIYRKNNRKIDLMNAGSIIDKFVCDALIELGILPDDNVEYIKSVLFVDGGIDKANPRAKLKIMEFKK